MDGVGKRKVQGWLVHKDCSLIKNMNQILSLIFLKISSRFARLQHLWISHPWKKFLDPTGNQTLDHPACSLITIQGSLPWLSHKWYSCSPQFQNVSNSHCQPQWLYNLVNWLEYTSIHEHTNVMIFNTRTKVINLLYVHGRIWKWGQNFARWYKETSKKEKKKKEKKLGQTGCLINNQAHDLLKTKQECQSEGLKYLDSCNTYHRLRLCPEVPDLFGTGAGGGDGLGEQLYDWDDGELPLSSSSYSSSSSCMRWRRSRSLCRKPQTTCFLQTATVNLLSSICLFYYCYLLSY